MNQKTSKKIPLKWALFWIFSSTILISGSLTSLFLYMEYQKTQKLQDPAFHIFAIVQTTTNKESLKNAFLAELLNLSVDKPVNLYQFDLKEGEKKILAHSLFNQAHLKKIHPGIIHIDYALRKPIAFLGDAKNTLIDAEGNLFPFKPFFTPKKYPRIYLGIDEEKMGETNTLWGTKIDDERFILARQILRDLESLSKIVHGQISLIDVSKAFAPSYGKRQIVLVEEQGVQKRYVRLNTEYFHQNLADYVQIRKTLALQSCVIDMRIPQIAYVQTL